MDDIVRQAMAKWPNVPDCYGWLGLDARGNWYMRDDRAQALGAFGSGKPGSKGSQLRHEKLIEFIERNYSADAQGRWLFQNGPQKVFVELEVTPWIWRVDSDFSVRAHSGERTEVLACLVDELGRVYFQTNLGFGLVHTLDVAQVADALQAGIWVTQEVRSQTLPARYGYVQSPQGESADKAGH
jgi:Protein of unknown function (DUF2946)